MQRHVRRAFTVHHRPHPSFKRRLGQLHRDGTIIRRLPKPQLHAVIAHRTDRRRLQWRSQDIRSEVLAPLSIVGLDAVPDKDLRPTGLDHRSARPRGGPLSPNTNARLAARTRCGIGRGFAGLAANDSGQLAEFSVREGSKQRHERRRPPRGRHEDAVGRDDVDMRARPKVGADGMQHSNRPRPAAPVPQFLVRTAFDRRDDALHHGSPECACEMGLAWQRPSPPGRRHQHPMTHRHRWQSAMGGTDPHRPPGTLCTGSGAGHCSGLDVPTRTTAKPKPGGTRSLPLRRGAHEERKLKFVVSRHLLPRRPRTTSVAKEGGHHLRTSRSPPARIESTRHHMDSKRHAC